MTATIRLRTVNLNRSPSVVNHLLKLLSDDEIDRAERFRFPRDRRRFIIRRAALRQIIAKEVGTPAEHLRFSAEPEFGRPFLAVPDATGLGFSSSHSEELGLIGLGASARFGVDMERVRRISDFAAVATRFFTPEEAAAIGEAGDALDRFYRTWVLKEAFVKALGQGLSHPLDSFSVAIGADPPHLLSAEAGDASAWHFRLFKPAPGWIAAVAAEHDPMATLDLRSWSFDAFPC
ncbi:MAG: 4'-phosphopantetheinyl transferase superfamily protein [Thalassobaculaceae bacterium]|uniref:4'-phosphopantetheinyl transferase family protein n=1 Tax=Roseitalea porphyridii TaxID=1852022 RepID=UPI0032EE233D